MIKTTFHGIIQHGKKELMMPLSELKYGANEDYIDTSQARGTYRCILTDEFLEGKPILPIIDELIRIQSQSQNNIIG